MFWLVAGIQNSPRSRPWEPTQTSVLKALKTGPEGATHTMPSSTPVTNMVPFSTAPPTFPLISSGKATVIGHTTTSAPSQPPAPNNEPTQWMKFAESTLSPSSVMSESSAHEEILATVAAAMRSISLTQQELAHNQDLPPVQFEKFLGAPDHDSMTSDHNESWVKCLLMT